VAIDVPDIYTYFPSLYVLGIETPGAKISTPGPKFDHDGLVSVLSIAPTVMAEGAEAGEKFRAS